jgi:hypothetical protein
VRRATLPDQLSGLPFAQRSLGLRYCLALFLILLIYDGALRKWLLTDFEQAIFIAKDVLLLAAFVAAFADQKRTPRVALPPITRLLFACYGLWVAVSAFNPNLPNVLVGLWGMKAHLLYAALVALLPLAFQSLDEIFRMLERIFPWVVIPVVLVALAQLAAPAQSTLNQNVRGGLESVAYFGDASLVRVSGTFSFVSGMAAFVQTCTLLGIGLFLSGARSKPFLLGLGIALLAVPVTGSRGVMVIIVVGAAILFVAALACRFITGRYVVIAGIVLALLTVVSLTSQNAAWEALAERTEHARGDENRAITAFTNAFAFMDSAGLFGFGTGAANFGAPALAREVDRFAWLPFGERFEEESGRIVIELGALGWLISLLMRAAFMVWAADIALRGTTRTVRVAGVLALPIVIYGFYSGNGVFAAPLAAAYYWFCIALLGMAQYEQRVMRRAVSQTGFGGFR